MLEASIVVAVIDTDTTMKTRTTALHIDYANVHHKNVVWAPKAARRFVSLIAHTMKKLSDDCISGLRLCLPLTSDDNEFNLVRLYPAMKGKDRNPGSDCLGSRNSLASNHSSLFLECASPGRQENRISWAYTLTTKKVVYFTAYPLLKDQP